MQYHNNMSIQQHMKNKYSIKGCTLITGSKRHIRSKHVIRNSSVLCSMYNTTAHMLLALVVLYDRYLLRETPSPFVITSLINP